MKIFLSGFGQISILQTSFQSFQLVSFVRFEMSGRHRHICQKNCQKFVLSGGWMR